MIYRRGTAATAGGRVGIGAKSHAADPESMSTGRYGSRYGTSLCGLSVYVFTGGQDVERFDATDSYACKRCAKAAAKAGA